MKHPPEIYVSRKHCPLSDKRKKIHSHTVGVKFIVQVYVLLRYGGLLLCNFFRTFREKLCGLETSGINYPVASRRIIEAS